VLFWKLRFNFSNPIGLDQTPTFENHIDSLASYHFSKIELEHECDPEPQLGNLIPLLDSMLTPVS